MSEKIERILKQLPDSPGIYKMINAEGKIIYIGKTKSLKKRVKQYFQKDYQHSSRTRKMLENLVDIKFTTVDSDLEATILETTLLKEYQPKYNIVMKDDKNYVYIKITEEAFPRIQIVREIKKDKAKYIGPKTAAHKVKETLKVLKKFFPFRHCNLNLDLKGKEVLVSNKVIKYPCLDYYIKRCIGPCTAKVSQEDYREIIRNVEDFLHGKAGGILSKLEKKMGEYARMREFEKAAKTRDKIEKIHSILERQKVSDPNQKDKDVINYLITRGKAYFNLFQIREGKLIGQENFTLSAEDIEDEEEKPEVMESFLKQYYEIASDIPKEILIPHPLENKSDIEMITKSKIIVPIKGDKNKLLSMSLKNARIFADRNKSKWQEESEDTKNAAKELAKIIGLKETPKRIECYDISHLGGTNTVGSMVVFENGAPKKNMYRKFKLKSTSNKIDDFQSLKEVLTRRFSRIRKPLEKLGFKKITKKDHAFIETNNKVKISEAKDKNFYIFSKEKKPIGFIATREISDKIAELTNLWLTKKERGRKLGYILMKSAMEKVKAKRVYIFCKPELKEYYQIAGFEEIKQTPPELKKRKEQHICLAYDKRKYKEDESFKKTPDLIIIDGGKGQLKMASDVLKELNLQIPHISLAKRLEEIFTHGRSKSILLERNNEALKLLQRARDEAHRFAISFNRDLRAKELNPRKTLR